MIEFYGYNDARAIKAYNKKNLTTMFIWFGIICFIVSIIAIAISVYELLCIWGAYFFILAICLFAMSFNKHDEKVFKEYNIKTKHYFKIEDLKLYRDGKEIKNVSVIKVYSYKTYMFLQFQKAYYYIPLEELNISKENLEKSIYEVIHQVDISKIINDVRFYVENSDIDGKISFTKNSIIWISGKHRLTYQIDYIETYVTLDKLTFNRFYRNITHYHIGHEEIIEDIKKRSHFFKRKTETI